MDSQLIFLIGAAQLHHLTVYSQCQLIGAVAKIPAQVQAAINKAQSANSYSQSHFNTLAATNATRSCRKPESILEPLIPSVN